MDGGTTRSPKQKKINKDLHVGYGSYVFKVSSKIIFVFIYENVAQALVHACFKVFSGQYCMPKLSRHVRSLKSMATLLNSISLPRSWLPIFIIALKSAPVYAQRPTDLQGMTPSAQTPRAEMARAQSHRAETPGAESGPCVPPTVTYLPYHVSGSTLTAARRSQLLARWQIILSRILPGIQRAAQTVLGVYIKRTCSRVT